MLNDLTIQKLKDKEILITGGTGSLGKTVVKILKTECDCRGIRIFSRDEFKQFEFRNELEKLGMADNISFLIGDVADSNRICRAMCGVDYVIAAAAMKQVPSCEHNPIEAVKTNIRGAENIINAALDTTVETVMHVSTDKAVQPVNLYGMTKGTAEKLYLHANVYTGSRPPYFSCCRYGNVLGSRGSIVPLFKKQREDGCIKITDPRMTRFWIQLKTVAEFILNRMVETKGADIFIPHMKSMAVIDLARLIAPEAKIETIGIRKGEKIHEVLITRDESLHTEQTMEYFRINIDQVNRVTDQEGFEYSSETSQKLTDDEMLGMIGDL